MVAEGCLKLLKFGEVEIKLAKIGSGWSLA